jgi:hypothetical protein
MQLAKLAGVMKSSVSSLQQSVMRREAKSAERKLSIAHRIVAEIETLLGADWIPRIYRERILTERTRTHDLPLPEAAMGKTGARVTVQHTLLGVELKIGKRRMLCPDLATARYLAVFARASCPRVAVPHNITKISRLADDLETSWEKMMLLASTRAAESSANPALRSRVQNLLVAKLRGEIESFSEEIQPPPAAFTRAFTKSKTQRA